MQTFLPYKSFTKSLQCLDNKRLGKQRVEAMQILNALELDSTSRWRNHPAVRMWRGYEFALECYHDLAIEEWISRGFNNSMQLKHPLLRKDVRDLFNIPWITPEFCSAHRSNLLRKDPKFYGQYGWTEPHDLPYIWPVN